MDEPEWEELADDVEDYVPEEEQHAEPTNLTQHTLLSYLVSNAEIWARVEPILKPEYFDDQYKRAVQYLIEHSQQFRQVPSIAIVRMKTGVHLDHQADATDTRTTDWLLQEIETFCRHRATEIEILRAAKSIQNDNSRAALEQIFQNFKTITEISLEKDIGIEVHRDAAAVLAMGDTQTTMPSQYVHLDKVTKGGFPCPGMVLLAGKSGKGKSVTLANLAVQYCQQSNFVVYVSLELPENRIWERVAAIMTNTKIWEVHKHPNKIIDDLGHRMTVGDGLLRVKKMKMSGTTISHVNAYLKELYIKEGIKPQVLVLDYLDLLWPRTKVDLSNIHIKDKYCSEETYALCEEWRILCFTASQMVKNSNDMDPFDDAAVGGGTPKINTVDYAIRLERKEAELIMQIFKGRYGGENTQVPFVWDNDTLRISDGSEEKFIDLNPWYGRNQNQDAGKEASALWRELNKDVHRMQTDHVIDKIHSMNHRNQDILDGRDERRGF